MAGPRLLRIGETDVRLAWETVPALVLLLLYLPLADAALTLLTFALHEAAHLLTARRLRVPVAEVRLLPFGALMALDAETESAEESVIALAGPLANLAAAGGASLYALLRPTEALAPFLRYNLCMGLLNLLPILPLDGGRVLRGSLHRLRPKTVRAITLTTSALGCAALLGAAGWLAWNGTVSPAALAFPCAVAAQSARFLWTERRSGVSTILRHRTRLHGGRALEILPLALNGTERLSMAAREVRGGRYALVYVLGSRGERLGTLGEEELLLAMGRLGGDATLRDALIFAK